MSSPDTMSPAADRPRFGLRFSLLTLFVLAIVLSLVISNLITSFHLQRSQEVIAEKEAQIEAQQTEIEQYRDRLGVLHIQDETKTHIIASETFQKMVWRWQVFVPKGEKYDISLVFGEISREGFPRDANSTRLESGESQVTFSVMLSPEGMWISTMELSQGIGGTTLTGEISDEKMEWYTNAGPASFAELAPQDGQQVFETDEQIELMRRRVWPPLKSGQSFTCYPEVGNGVLLWLEPVNKADDVDS